MSAFKSWLDLEESAALGNVSLPLDVYLFGGSDTSGDILQLLGGLFPRVQEGELRLHIKGNRGPPALVLGVESWFPRLQNLHYDNFWIEDVAIAYAPMLYRAVSEGSAKTGNNGWALQCRETTGLMELTSLSLGPGVLLTQDLFTVALARMPKLRFLTLHSEGNDISQCVDYLLAMGKLEKITIKYSDRNEQLKNLRTELSSKMGSMMIKFEEDSFM